MPDLGTYFARDNRTGMYRIFDIEKCDKCGGEMLAANSARVGNPERDLLKLGYKRKDCIPPEGSFDIVDGEEMVNCEACL